MKKNNSIKNFIWNAIGLTFNAFNSLFFLIATKYINGMNIAGIFTYAFSLCCLFYFLSTYYNRTFQVADYNGKYTFNQYLTNRLITTLISLLLIALFAIISGFDFFKINVIILIMIFRSLESISDCYYAEMQKKEQLYKVGISLTVKAIMGLLLFVIIDILTNNIFISIFGIIVVNLIIFIFYDYKNCDIDKYKWDCSKFKFLIIETFPVFIFSFLSVYLANCEKYVMTYFLNNEMQTIFGILIMPATMLSLVGSYLIMPFITDLTNKAKKKDYLAFNKNSLTIIEILLICSLFALICCNFIGIPFLNLVYSINLAAYKNALLIIILAAILNAVVMILSNLLTILDENKSQSIVYLISSILATIISIILISKYQIEGAAIAYLISMIVNLILYTLLYFYKLNRLEKK